MMTLFFFIRKNSKKDDETVRQFVSGHWKDETPIDYKATFITAIKQPS